MDLLSIVLIVISLVLIVLILMQERGESGFSGFLGASGGGGGGVYQKRRGLEKTLFRATIILVILFAGLSLWSLFT